MVAQLYLLYVKEIALNRISARIGFVDYLVIDQAVG